MADRIETARGASTGHVSCRAEEMVIEEVVYESGFYNWQVTCPNGVFMCSKERASAREHAETHCSLLAPQAPAMGQPQPAVPQPYYVPAAGCSYDTQCKAGRVCRNQACVEP
ncbi:MAG: hypothetical protein KC492_27625 [Myxococcales bacterium]|nr:hypothetical protein [Myxococcales bacterium]